MKMEQYITIKSPINDEVLGQVIALSQMAVDEKIQKSKQALKGWRETSLYERGQFLYKAADLLVQKSDELIDLLMKEVGKDRECSKRKICDDKS